MRIHRAMALALALALLASAAWREPAKAEEAADAWLNILLLGTDVRDAADGYGNADSMIVLSVNRDTGAARLTSFMRDLWVNIPGVKGKHKLNAACRLGGPERVMETLNNYFDLDLRYYALVDLRCMAEIVDQLGGLRLDVTEAERKALNKGLANLSDASGMAKLEASGKQVLLNGNQTVAYARIRRIDSDYRRTERQRTVLTALARQLQAENPLALAGVLAGIAKHLRTNLDLKQLTTLAGIGLRTDLEQVRQYRVPAEGTYEDGMLGSVWCIRADMKRNKALLWAFIRG